MHALAEELAEDDSADDPAAPVGHPDRVPGAHIGAEEEAHEILVPSCSSGKKVVDATAELVTCTASTWNVDDATTSAVSFSTSTAYVPCTGTGSKFQLCVCCDPS